MSCFIVFYKRGAKHMRPIKNREEYMAIRAEQHNLDALAAARMGNKLAKSRLTQMNYSCYPNKDGKLRGSIYPTQTVAMDIDINPSNDDSDLLSSISERILKIAKDLGLLMLERSVTKGYHLVFRRKQELSQFDNLRWASSMIGVPFDDGAKDITRVFYTTGVDDLLYLDDALFDDNDVDETIYADSENEAPQVLSQQMPSDDNKTTDDEIDDNDDLTISLKKILPSDCYKDTYNGHTIADIIESFFVLYNNGRIPRVGNRNSMTFELAKSLRCIVDYNIDSLQKYIPRFAGFAEAEWIQTLNNANNEPRKGIDFKLRKVLQNLEEVSPVDTDSRESLQSIIPPAMPKRLPYPLSKLSSKVPDYYKPAVCESLFAPLATHLHGVKFVYWDNQEHEPTIMSLLVAPMSTGKGCIRKPISIILDSIKQRDDLNRIREGEWKLANQGKIKKATPRPTDICIQVLIDNLTDAVFNQRVIDADRNGGRFLYTQCDELDTLKQLTSKGSAEQVSIIIRKAFDNSLHGQERVGSESITGLAPLRFNFNASTTIPNCRRFFWRGVNDGTITRLSLSTIVVPVGSPRPVFGDYDDEYRAVVDNVVKTLATKTGQYKCRNADKFVFNLLEENEQLADLYGSESYLVLSYRATVIAWIKGMILYLINGRWSKDIETYVRWSLRYDLWCKMQIFGSQLETEIEKETEKSVCRTNNLLNSLPNTFTLNDMKALKKPNGSYIANPRNLLAKWISRGYVDFNEKNGTITKKI